MQKFSTAWLRPGIDTRDTKDCSHKVVNLQMLRLGSKVKKCCILTIFENTPQGWDSDRRVMLPLIYLLVALGTLASTVELHALYFRQYLFRVCHAFCCVRTKQCAEDRAGARLDECCWVESTRAQRTVFGVSSIPAVFITAYIHFSYMWIKHTRANIDRTARLPCRGPNRECDAISQRPAPLPRHACAPSGAKAKAGITMFLRTSRDHVGHALARG